MDNFHNELIPFVYFVLFVDLLPFSELIINAEYGAACNQIPAYT